MTYKQRVDRLYRAKELMYSDESTQDRVCNLNTGDVVIVSLCVGYVYVTKMKDRFSLRHIREEVDGNLVVEWRGNRGFEYGLKCKLWVTKKLLKPIKSNYEKD